MSKARVAVMKIMSKQLTVSAAADEYGFSRRHLHRLLARYREGGLDAVEPRSRAPRSSPQATTDQVRDRILQLRGKVSLRRAGRMHHLGIGYAHRGTRILALADDSTVTVIALHTGEILSTHLIDPTRSYWRNQQEAPGRWPRASSNET